MIIHLLEKMKDHLYLKKAIKYKACIDLERWQIAKNPAERRIGFIYTVDPNDPLKTDAVLRTAGLLREKCQEVRIIAYVPRKVTPPQHKEIIPFSSWELSILKKSNNDAFWNFIATRFDFVFHVDLVSDITLDYIINISRAQCRCGYEIPRKVSAYELLYKPTMPKNQLFSHYEIVDNLVENVQKIYPIY